MGAAGSRGVRARRGRKGARRAQLGWGRRARPWGGEAGVELLCSAWWESVAVRREEGERGREGGENEKKKRKKEKGKRKGKGKRKREREREIKIANLLMMDHEGLIKGRLGLGWILDGKGIELETSFAKKLKNDF